MRDGPGDATQRQPARGTELALRDFLPDRAAMLCSSGSYCAGRRVSQWTLTVSASSVDATAIRICAVGTRRRNRRGARLEIPQKENRRSRGWSARHRRRHQLCRQHVGAGSVGLDHETAGVDPGHDGCSRFRALRRARRRARAVIVSQDDSGSGSNRDDVTVGALQALRHSPARTATGRRVPTALPIEHSRIGDRQAPCAPRSRQPAPR